MPRSFQVGFRLAYMVLGFSAALLLTIAWAEPQDASNKEASRPVTQTTGSLEPGHPVFGTLAPGERRELKLELAPRQYAGLTIEPQEIDVAVDVHDTADNLLVKVTSAYGAQGPVKLSLLGNPAGSYRIQVISTNNNARSGPFKVSLSELRPQTKADLVRMATQNLVSEADDLLEKGTTEARKSASAKYALAEARLKESTDPLTEARILEQWASVLQALGQNQKALSLFKSSLDRFEKSADRRGVGMTLTDIGSLLNDMGDNKEALAYLNRALPVRREVGDRRGEAQTQEYLGDVYENTSDSIKALENYEAALTIRREIGDLRGKAESLDDIGVVYDDIDEERKGIEYFMQALKIQEDLRDSWGQAITLNNFGTAYDSLGEKEKALTYFGKAIELKRATGNRRGEGTTLSNMCWSELTLGYWQSAFQHCNAALDIGRAIGDKEGEAQSLTNIGLIYANAGDPHQALKYFQKALWLTKISGYRLYEGIALNSIGLVHYELGDYSKALSNYTVSLSLRRAVGDHSGEAATLNNIGNAKVASGHLSDAPGHFRQALQIASAAASPRWQAASYANMGWLYVKVREPEKALEQFSQALPLDEKLDDGNGAASVLFGLARSKRDLDDLAGALTNIESALKIIETQRTRVSSLQLRTSYMSSVHEYYEFYVDLLMLLDESQPGKDWASKAFEASERSRARGVLEILQGAQVKIRRGVDPNLLEQEQSVQSLIEGKTERLSRLLSENRSESQISAAKEEIAELIAEQQQINANIRATSPEYAALILPEPITLSAIQKRLLHDNTILLEYSLGSDRSYLWAVTSATLNSFRLPNRTELEALTRKAYEQLSSAGQGGSGENGARLRNQSSENGVSPTLTLQLSQVLLGPIANLIPGRRLAIIPDGVLHYLPFGILPEPIGTDSVRRRNPLVVGHEIVYLPSASVLALIREGYQRRKAAPKTVAVLADPVFDRTDPRVRSRPQSINTSSKSRENDDANKWEAKLITAHLARSVVDVAAGNDAKHLPRLLFTRREAEAILSLTPGDMSFGALDFKASRQNIKGSELGQYKIIHLATHGLLDSEHPELSGLVFSLVNESGSPQNGFLDLHDVYNLELSANMVVLSACETGLGKEVKGEGLVGLARGFMYSGAPRVAASLWRVDDVATAELMKRFYTGMLKDGKRPAEALREAQVEMWSQKRWSSPYYWASFTLQGEWE